MWRFFKPKYHVWLWWEFKFHHTGTHHVTFLCFSKSKSLELQCHLEQDKQQLRPSHIIPINYLDLDQAYDTHEFQVQSKSLYQNSHIQNSGEFKAKNQVLERNYNRATIHHFHFKGLSSESILFIYLLKEIKTNQTHLLFCFQLFIFLTYIKSKLKKTIKQIGKRYLPGYTGMPLPQAG